MAQNFTVERSPTKSRVIIQFDKKDAFIGCEVKKISIGVQKNADLHTQNFDLILASHDTNVIYENY